eukprot:TRINITY_DN40791_c0_g1_i1.p1 TRINITY_DN40791_c0_g1~~TRINITY_DN40791_c0_g1_i1.p1  ORF type:complete len:182 (-),score=10.72 TRINITY_DN40791_c0_g1_i1:8-553(-)
MRAYQCDQLEAYMDDVDKLAKAYGIRDVFLSSDSGQPVIDTQEYPEYNWIYENRPPAFDTEIVPEGMRVEEAITKKIIDGKAIGHSAFMDILLLSEGQVIVGKFMSNTGRAALEFGAGKNACLTPYASLDSSWCFDYGVDWYSLPSYVSKEVDNFVRENPDADDEDKKGTEEDVRSYGFFC